jgi:hypothetical protein
LFLLALLFFWYYNSIQWDEQELNPRPGDYESHALTN